MGGMGGEMGGPGKEVVGCVYVSALEALKGMYCVDISVLYIRKLYVTGSTSVYIDRRMWDNCQSFCWFDIAVLENGRDTKYSVVCLYFLVSTCRDLRVLDEAHCSPRS